MCAYPYIEQWTTRAERLKIANAFGINTEEMCRLHLNKKTKKVNYELLRAWEEAADRNRIMTERLDETLKLKLQYA